MEVKFCSLAEEGWCIRMKVSRDERVAKEVFRNLKVVQE